MKNFNELYESIKNQFLKENDDEVKLLMTQKRALMDAMRHNNSDYPEENKIRQEKIRVIDDKIKMAKEKEKINDKTEKIQHEVERLTKKKAQDAKRGNVNV